MGKQFRMAAIFLLLFLLILYPALIHQAITVKAEVNTNKPRVVLTDYKISEDTIVPGKEFDLTLTLKNPSSVYNLNSLLLTFTNDVNLVFPVYGQADQVYIDSILAGESKEITLTLKAGENITAQSIKFQLDMTYADDEKTNNNNTVTLQLPITTTRKFEIQNVSLPDTIYEKSKTRMQVTYKNTGVNDFYNITMYIKGDGLSEDLQVSLGSLLAGKTSYAEAYVNFEESGKQKVEIEFSYEDMEGNKFTTEPYSVDLVAEKNTGTDSTVLSDTYQEAGLKAFVPKITLGGAILLMGVFFLFQLRSYKSRR